MNDDPLCRNLATLCSYRPSIAEVCRKLGINRQQFNKYLNGRSRPSRHNMRRICDFFGVTESEMLLEPVRFEELVSIRRQPIAEGALAGPLSHVDRLFSESSSLDRYLGYYYRYFYSFGYAGKVMKSLCVLFEENGRYFWKNIEVMRQVSTSHPTSVSKYLGVAFHMADRIFIVEYDSLLRNAITQVTLYPSYHARVDYMLGVQTGGPVRRGRKPGASRVLFEYLGRHIDVRKALAQADLIPEDDPRIDQEVRELIRNEIPDGSYVFEVDQI